MWRQKTSDNACTACFLKEKLDSCNGSNKFHRRNVSLSEEPLGLQGGKGHAGRFAQVNGEEKISLDFDNTVLVERSQSQKPAQ